MDKCYNIFPESYLGGILKLCIEKRGIQKDINFSVIE